MIIIVVWMFEDKAPEVTPMPPEVTAMPLL